MNRFVTALGLILSVAACSSKDESTRTRAEFCQEWAAQACSPAVVSACQASDAAACRLSQQAFCMELVPPNYSDAAADGCLAAVGAAYADADLTGTELETVLRLGQPCSRIVDGPSDLGEGCMDDRDCKGPLGHECVVKGGQTLGTCQSREVVGAGLRCAAAQQVCMPGFHCDGANCIEAKLPGEPCANDEECGTASFCNASGSCEGRAPVDAACTDNEQCQSNTCYNFAADDRTCVDRLRLSRAEPACETLR